MNLADREAAPFWRAALAFLLAPLLPIALFSLRESGFSGRFFETFRLAAMLGTYPLVLLVGVPLYGLLHRWVRPNLLVTSLVAGAIAASPWLLLMLASGQGSSQVGSVVVMEGGRLTWAGLLLRLQFLGEVFALGAIAGAIFWLMATQPRRTPDLPQQG